MRIADGCATVTFSRPHRRNAFTHEMFVSLQRHLAAAGENDQVKAIVLTGEIGAFCSGVDTAFFDEPLTASQMKAGVEDHVQRVGRTIDLIDIPVIAAISGPAVGAGMDLACMADVRVAASDAMFMTGYIRLGLAPGGGGAYLLPRVIGESGALELLLTGRRVDADEALRLGLVSTVVSPEKLADVAADLAGQMSRWDRAALRLTKRAVRASANLSMPQALDLASSHVAVLAAPTQDTR